jgi:FkbM family methyltransferase
MPSIRRRSDSPTRDGLAIIGYIWQHPSNRHRRFRTIATALRYQLRGRLLKKPTIVKIGARSRFVAHPQHGMSGLVYANPLEWREIGVWKKTLKQGDLFVDAGAHVGSYTIWAIELGASVVAIEPDPDAVAMLRENLALNGYSADVRQAAVADRPGTAHFTAGGGVLNHLIPPGEPVPADARPVDVVTLDDVIGDRVVAGVKVDVEGAESLVIRGAMRALRERRIKLIQFEWNSATLFGESREETAAFLESLGYEFFRPGDEGEEIPLKTPGPMWDVFARPAPDGARK